LDLDRKSVKPLGNSDNEYRVQCTVRQLIIWRRAWGLKVFRQYIDKTKFDSHVWDLYYEQFKLGNQGRPSEWLNNTSLPQQELAI